jgi:HPt (histidine-containing phosphotransfer) domain-containing protein
MMNSNAHPDRRLTEGNATMDACVAKPITPVDLQKTIDQLAVPPHVEAAGYDLDRDAIFALVEGDLELFGELVELFLDSYPSQLLDIREGISGGDPGRITEAAHSLKGSVANFQATSAVELATSLEVMGRQGDLSLAPQKLTELEMEMSLLNTALTALRIEVGV